MVSKQEPDGGWSESMKACETHTYVPSGQSMVVQTAWAVIALILGGYPNREAIDKGIKLIMQRQSLEGEWKFEDVEGVFNHSCAIEYPTYKFYSQSKRSVSIPPNMDKTLHHLSKFAILYGIYISM